MSSNSAARVSGPWAKLKVVLRRTFTAPRPIAELESSLGLAIVQERALREYICYCARESWKYGLAVEISCVADNR
jgi:hypothetical protein